MDDSARVSKLLAMMFSANEQEHQTAARSLVLHCEKQNIHPSQLIIEIRAEGNLTDRAMTLLESYRNQLHAVQRENSFLRQTVGKRRMAQFTAAGEIENRWEFFETAARERVFAGHLPRGWRNRLAVHLGVTETVMKRWEDGLERISDAALETVRTMTAPASWQQPTARASTASAKLRKARQRAPMSPFVASVVQALAALPEGATAAEIERRLGYQHGEVSKRMNELMRRGLVTGSPIRRDGGRVWLIAARRADTGPASQPAFTL